MSSLPWKRPLYCISIREGDLPDEMRRPWMRRRECCDCGQMVVYEPAPLLWELLRPYLVICAVCAHERTIETGSRRWTWTVEPRPRPS